MAYLGSLPGGQPTVCDHQSHEHVAPTEEKPVCLLGIAFLLACPPLQVVPNTEGIGDHAEGFAWDQLRGHHSREP